jgi:hypothetical protein
MAPNMVKRVRFKVMWRQKLVAPTKAGAQEMLPCPWISPLDSGLRRNDEVAKVNLRITLNRTRFKQPF